MLDDDEIERVAKVLWGYFFTSDWPPEHEADLNMDAPNFRKAASLAIKAMRAETMGDVDRLLDELYQEREQC